MCAHTSQIQKVEQLEEQYKVKLSDESKEKHACSVAFFCVRKIPNRPIPGLLV